MTFHALNGDVKVPKNPKRIAVQNYPDEVASLGANVVGTDSWAFPNTFLSKDQKKNMVDLGAPKFNMEKLIAQNPDLIITVDKDQVADYQKVAPTVLVNYKDLSGMNKSLDYFAKLLNREDEKASFLKNFKKKKPISKKKNWQRLMLNQLKIQFRFLNFKEIRFMPSVTILLVVVKP